MILKRDNKIFMLLPGNRYAAMQGGLLRRAKSIVNGKIWCTI